VSLLVLTDRRQARHPLPWVVARAVDGGARTVVLREKDLPRAQRLALAEALRAVLAPVGGRLIVAGPDPLGGNAVHLGARDALPPAIPYVGRSCHDAEELARLSTEDYATVSPVYVTESKPGYGPALGVEALGVLAFGTDKPVYALGGITTPGQAAECVAAGAAGVAVMGAVMRAADPRAVVEDLGKAVVERLGKAGRP
jgi:thiamine-phosphate diphosphorylase